MHVNTALRRLGQELEMEFVLSTNLIVVLMPIALQKTARGTHYSGVAGYTLVLKNYWLHLGMLRA